MTTIAIPAMRVPPGSLIRAGTHGVVTEPGGEDRWVVRFDTGYAVEVDEEDLEPLKPPPVIRAAPDRPRR